MLTFQICYADFCEDPHGQNDHPRGRTLGHDRQCEGQDPGQGRNSSRPTETHLCRKAARGWQVRLPFLCILNIVVAVNEVWVDLRLSKSHLSSAITFLLLLHYMNRLFLQDFIRLQHSEGVDSASGAQTQRRRQEAKEEGLHYPQED